MSGDNSTMPALPCENAKHIPGHPGYAATTDGDIFSCMKMGPKGYGWALVWRRLNPTPYNEPGHLKVALERGKQILVHRLVLLTFVGPCPNGMEACHFPDSNPANNRLENLRWGTHKENFEDYRKHGLRPALGERCSKSKLTTAQVIEARAAMAAGAHIPTLAVKYDITARSMYAIRARKNWGHVA